MSGSGRPAAADGQGGTGSAAAAPPPDCPEPGPAWLTLIPALVTLLVGLYKITGPSFTRDESATLAAVHRSFPQLVRMLGHVDVVHGAYYALIWVVVRVGGSGEFALRLPSAIAMAVAAAMVTILGRRLVSSWAGLAAGLTFAFLPQVSWFAENAREGAVLTALACVASYCLLRALPEDAARDRWRCCISAPRAGRGRAPGNAPSRGPIRTGWPGCGTSAPAPQRCSPPLSAARTRPRRSSGSG